MEPINKNWTDNGLHQGGVSTGVGYTISWQRGAVAVEGRNGAYLIEVLQSCLNQIEYFQELNPSFKCVENEEAIAHLKSCIQSLQARRDRREKDGTLGTHQPESDRPPAQATQGKKEVLIKTIESTYEKDGRYVMETHTWGEAEDGTIPWEKTDRDFIPVRRTASDKANTFDAVSREIALKVSKLILSEANASRKGDRQ